MKRIAKQFIITASIVGVLLTVHSFYSAIHPMTDEQYAREAQNILSYSPSQSHPTVELQAKCALEGPK